MIDERDGKKSSKFIVKIKKSSNRAIFQHLRALRTLFDHSCLTEAIKYNTLFFNCFVYGTQFNGRSFHQHRT